MVVLEEKQGLDLMNEAFTRHKKEVASLRIEPTAKRKARLVKLRDWIHANRRAIHEAMYSDFQKNPTEVDTIELYHVLAEIKHSLANLDVWAHPKKVDAPLTMLGTRSFIQYEPRGVVLIISPWNYPFSLCIGPLVSALAAGNAVVLKPSELTPHVAAIISRMVKDIFEPSVVSCFEGGHDISTRLLKLPFDHIFFTGSPAIGKVVMKAAAENLTSVTLELGGKSPVIVTGNASLKDAAQRIAFTKFVNNGQTCVAPDYVLIDERLRESFTKKLIEQIKKLFAENGGSIEESSHYCRIVNERHFARLNDLLTDALNNGARLEFGGNVNSATRFIHPIVLSNVSLSSRIMEEEIFGPILPIVGYKDLAEAIKIVNDKPKALALYIFTNDSKLQEKILSETSAGGVCVNDCGVHFFHHNLPFGGVNNSGIGKSHGYYGFLAFSNEKPVLKQRGGLTTIQPFLPPYTKFSQKFMDWFLKLF
ncbi:MAG TPA: aldehyde dehydrogenase family protein [Chryseolinea sp.]